MASVFLSYDRDDAAKARSIAAALEKAGHSVWWDRHIKGGAQFSREIEAALKAADAVVVLWSEQSVESAWVRDEAAAGRDSGRLVPVRLDTTEPPLGFRQYQTIDLPRGRMPPAKRGALLSALQSIVGAKAPPPVRPKSLGRELSRSLVAWIAVGLTFAAIVTAVLAWRPWGAKDELVLAVGPAASDAASQALARDLTMKLAGMQTASSGAIRLVDASDAKQEADLVFEATATPGAAANAGMILKSAKDSSILWSRDFEQPSGKRADLLQQMAYTAARVTGCAIEGLDGPVRLKPAPLKTYLNACAQLAEIATASPEPPIPMLIEVTGSSLRFTPAWAKLLLAEADLIGADFRPGEINARAVVDLRRHIAEAREVDPTMAEAAVAEALLLPPRDYARRAERIGKAAAQSPDNPVILTYLAATLAETGRMREAVDAAARAAQLDPLSPNIHSNFTALLAYAGAFDAARRELAKAEKLWPGTASLWDSQYRFHLRYGDPNIARRIFEEQTDSEGGRAQRMFLETRQNPTPVKVDRFLAYVGERMRNMSNPSMGISFAILAYGHFGRNEEILATLLSWPRPDEVAAFSNLLFRPEFGGLRRDPRILRVFQRSGLLDYWRSSGNWPDFCYESGKTYDCKAEAAKLAA